MPTTAAAHSYFSLPAILSTSGKMEFFPICCCCQQLPDVSNVVEKQAKIFRRTREEVLRSGSGTFAVPLYLSLVALIKIFLQESSPPRNQFEQIQSGYVHSNLDVSYIPFFPLFVIPSRRTIFMSGHACHTSIYWRIQSSEY